MEVSPFVMMHSCFEISLLMHAENLVTVGRIFSVIQLSMKQRKGIHMMLKKNNTEWTQQSEQVQKRGQKRLEISHSLHRKNKKRNTYIQSSSYKHL